ncbi:hypothetical protein FKM82_010092 [Ascaphus truei]
MIFCLHGHHILKLQVGNMTIQDKYIVRSQYISHLFLFVLEKKNIIHYIHLVTVPVQNARGMPMIRHIVEITEHRAREVCAG